MNKQFAHYESYKDSEVEWLGEIPAHWNTVRSKRLFQQRKDSAKKEDQQLTASQKYGVIYQADFMELEGRKVTQVEYNYGILKRAEAGDFLISMRSFQGGLEYCKNTGSVSSAYVAIIPTKHVTNEYYKYLFKSQKYIRALSSTSNLVRDGQALRFENFSMVDLLIIPKHEQKQIADFLDKKTAQIDEAIAQKEKMIEFLKEYRQITINNAVTKGLDQNVPMKDSGIEWLGQIPAHWEVKKNTYVCSKISSGTTPTAGIQKYYEDGNINWLQTGDLNDGTISNTSKKITKKALQDFNTLKIYPKHSTVIAMYGATIGKTGYLELETSTNQACCVLVPHKNIYSKYSFYWFNNSKPILISLGYGGGQPNISQDLIKNQKFVVPPIEEQKQIADFLDKKTAQLDDAISLKHSEIEKLKEYKATLIDSAVTGKIKV